MNGDMCTREQLPQGWGRERTFPSKVQLRSVRKTTAAYMNISCLLTNTLLK